MTAAAFNTATAVHPVDERLPTPRLAALDWQHVLLMYTGAVALPLTVGRALKRSPDQIVQLISADLFCCGIVTPIQSLGFTRWFGVKLPVMMGVTFASVGPRVATVNAVPGLDGARGLFGAIIGAGLISILRAAAQPHAALLSAGGHRHHHQGDRHQPDARGRRLGEGRAAEPGAKRRRAQAGSNGGWREGRCTPERTARPRPTRPIATRCARSAPTLLVRSSSSNTAGGAITTLKLAPASMRWRIGGAVAKLSAARWPLACSNVASAGRMPGLIAAALSTLRSVAWAERPSRRTAAQPMQTGARFGRRAGR